MGRKAVILLDDEPGLAGRHEKMLKSAGYEVYRPQSLAEVRVLLDTGQISVVVHSCNKTKTHTPICSEISQHFPDLPTLHLETGNGICQDHRKKGILHRVLGHLGPERGFVQSIKTLGALGRLKYRERVNRTILKEIESVDLLLHDLESPNLMHTMLEQVENWTGATDVVWMTPEDTDYYVNEIWKVKSLATAEPYVRPAEERALSRKPITPEFVTSLLNQASKVWDENWKAAGGPLVSDSLLILPVRDLDDGSPMGFFFVTQPNHMKIGAKYWLNRFAYALKQSRKYMEARSLCYIDDVTELYNQRYLGLALDAEIGRAKRNDAPFSVLFM
ncbi:MAG: hypothetical protein ABL958_10500, partial [Bdellovibrionia bacterium]